MQKLYKLTNKVLFILTSIWSNFIAMYTNAHKNFVFFSLGSAVSFPPGIPCMGKFPLNLTTRSCIEFLIPMAVDPLLSS